MATATTKFKTKAADKANSMPSERAFRASGRFNVRVVTPPVSDRRINGVSVMVIPSQLYQHRCRNALTFLREASTPGPT